MSESDAARELQGAADRLRDLIREAISESPHVRSELKRLRENGHHVLMNVEISLAFQKDAGRDSQLKRAFAAAAGDAVSQPAFPVKVEATPEGRKA
jgi:hypothetical protein